MLRVAVAVQTWAVALLLLAVAINLKNPHLLSVRDAETPVVLFASAIGAAVALWQARRATNRRTRVERSLLFGLLLTAAAVTVIGEARYRYMKQWVLGSSEATLLELGRHFIVGHSDLDQLLPLIEKGLVGGIFITQRNVRGQSAEQVAATIRRLQELSVRSGFGPLLIATDQEGGMVSRLSPPLPEQPALSTLIDGKRSLDQLEAAATAYGETQGHALAQIGVTINFAPVVDLKPVRPAGALDFYSLIAERAISQDATVVSRVALGYAHGLERSGIVPTVKHFPGLGGVSTDTHLFGAQLPTPRIVLESNDWIPFRHVLQGSGALLMLAHVTLLAVDPDHPASSSRRLVHGIIRDTWQHDGVLVTDDLTMGGAYNRGLCGTAVDAINAGVDLLLVSYDGDKFYAAMYCLTQAAHNHQLDQQMLADSARRLEVLRGALRLNK